ncbi:MAG: UbiA family prenyltransferase [Candidatus Bathyarchaeia archaeon]
MLVYVFSSLLYGVNPEPLLLQASFMITLAVYTLNLYTDGSEDEINKGTPCMERRHFLMISALSIAVALGIGALYGARTLLVISFPLLSGLVYSLKLLPCLPRLKEVLGGKSLTVAFTWAITGTLLPGISWRLGVEVPAMVFTYIFIQLFINTVLFDMIDMEGDLESGIITIPIHLDRTGTVRLLLAMNTLSLLWVIYILLRGLFQRYLLGLLFGVLYSYILIYLFGCREKRRLLQEVFIDGEWIPIVGLLLAIR